MRFCGIVVEGDRIGRTMGFPTANLHIEDPEVRKTVPSGVFACRVTLEDGSVYGGMMNIGSRPTIVQSATSDKSPVPTIEVHLFNYQGDLYGRRLQIEIIRKIRNERKFDSLNELKARLEQDRREALAGLSGEAPA